MGRTYEETANGIKKHEDHHTQDQAFVDPLRRYAHQSGPDSQLRKANGKQIDGLADKVDTQSVHVFVGREITAMFACSVLCLHDRQGKTHDCAGRGQSDQSVLRSGVSSLVCPHTSIKHLRPNQSCEASIYERTAVP